MKVPLSVTAAVIKLWTIAGESHVRPSRCELCACAMHTSQRFRGRQGGASRRLSGLVHLGAASLARRQPRGCQLAGRQKLRLDPVRHRRKATSLHCMAQGLRIGQGCKKSQYRATSDISLAATFWCER